MGCDPRADRPEMRVRGPRETSRDPEGLHRQFRPKALPHRSHSHVLLSILG